MMDIKFIRQNPQAAKKGIEKKQVKIDIDRLLKIDGERRKLLRKIEETSAQKNRGNEEIKKAKSSKEKREIITQLQEIDKEVDKLNEKFKKTDQEFQKMMQLIPNIPFDDVPVGKDDKNNVVLREVGDKPKIISPKDYLDIAQKLDLIDVERAAKVSGSRFGYLKREAVLLEFALTKLAMDFLIKKGFVPVVPPVMLKPEAMEAMGYAERGSDEIYFLEKDNLYLVGTSEQSIGAMHKDEVFEEEELPLRYVGFSTCFRREAGAYGKDTRGILRVHQFDKIEMFSFCHPAKSKEEHQFLLSLEEELMQKLKIPYRVINICTGDLGDPAAAKYDIEAWMPGQNQYRETHSTSNCTDFQARRLNIKYADKKAKKSEFVHTLNGTVFAVGRMLIAIIENYQEKDGSIRVPEVFQEYLKKSEIKKD